MSQFLRDLIRLIYRAAARPFAAYEEPIFSSYGNGTDGVLRQVVIRSEPAVVQIPTQVLFLFQCIVDGLAQGSEKGSVWFLSFSSRANIPSKNRTGPLPAYLTALFGIHIPAGGLHLVIQTGNAGQDIRSFQGSEEQASSNFLRT